MTNLKITILLTLLVLAFAQCKQKLRDNLSETLTIKGEVNAPARADDSKTTALGVARIASLQYCPALGDKEANLRTVDSLMQTLEGQPLDMVVLPEFFSTGICHSVMTGCPEDSIGGETIAHIRALARQYKVNVVAGSVVERGEEGLYNTTFAIDRNGEIVAKYRKIHLFSYLGGTEHHRITPGSEIVVAHFDFATVGLCICFDIRYPEHFRQLMSMGADILVCPTAWCALHAQKDMQTRIWQSFNVARASENLTYFVSCNGTGPIDNRIINTGHSMITSPYGEVLADANEEVTAIIAEVDLSVKIISN